MPGDPDRNFSYLMEGLWRAESAATQEHPKGFAIKFAFRRLADLHRRRDGRESAHARIEEWPEPIDRHDDPRDQIDADDLRDYLLRALPPRTQTILRLVLADVPVPVSAAAARVGISYSRAYALLQEAKEVIAYRLTLASEPPRRRRA